MTPMIHEAATYVQITRDELEDWLDSIGFRSKWERDSKYKGVYLLKLSPTVAIKLSSTIGAEGAGMDVGKASMQLRLVSTATGHVLNKKAQGKSHFKRTSGWKKTWQQGIETMKRAYLASSDFYDAISVIKDRDAYQRDMMDLIKSVPGWDTDNELANLHRKVERGGVLMPREVDFVEKAKSRPAKMPDPQGLRDTGEDVDERKLEQRQRQEAQVDALRKLWVVARRANDEWTMQFTQDMAQKYVQAGRAMSGPQIRVIVEKLKKYGIVALDGQPAFKWF